jgi:ubiquinone/menaquinone biosynthesis C-methylase UbiE
MTLASLLRKMRTFLPQEILGPLAVVYEKVAIPGLRRFHEQVASEITSTLKSGKALDIGTGPGHLLVEVARRNPNLELTGYDLSRTMLNIAKQLIEQDGRKCINSTAPDPAPTTVSSEPSIRLIRGDVRNLPFSDNAFDLVVSTLSIHHWHDPAKGIRECVRVTAPGGRCWIYDLRTDIPPRSYHGLITGRKLVRFLLGWVFKFHGVSVKRFEAPTVKSWLRGPASVKVEVYSAYLKICIEKSPGRIKDGTMHSTDTSSVTSPILSA